MKLYFAGKMNSFGQEWRAKIVTGLAEFSVEVAHQEARGDEVQFPILEKSILGKHDYVGPYYLDCQHGCYQGNSSHGVGAMLLPGNWEDTDTHPHEWESRRAAVLKACHEAISKCDALFAWIDSKDAYGTFAEVGMAHMAGKKIYVAGPQILDDLWFVYEMASDLPVETMNPELAVKHLFGRVEYYEYIASYEWRAKADAAKANAGFRCQICNAPDYEVQLDAHHRTYERLGVELPGDITVLCHDCHGLYEANKKLNKPAAKK